MFSLDDGCGWILSMAAKAWSGCCPSGRRRSSAPPPASTMLFGPSAATLPAVCSAATCSNRGSTSSSTSSVENGMPAWAAISSRKVRAGAASAALPSA